MSILHYFSSDKNKKARFIFNSIAAVYKKIDFINSTHYANAIAFVNKEIDISNKSVLDIGTGTGDWGAMFLNNDAKKVVGIDFAEKMIENGKTKNPKIEFQLGNAEDLANIADNSFNIVTASFVVHGADRSKRDKMISEMHRIAKSHVILHDFLDTTPHFIRLLEFLEQSDYKHFKKHIITELGIYFEKINSHKIKKGTGIYICSN